MASECFIDLSYYKHYNTLVYLLIFLFLFYLCIYLPGSQESDGGAMHRVSNYHDQLPEMPRYCCPLVI